MREGVKARRCEDVEVQSWVGWIAMVTRPVSRFKFTDGKPATKVAGKDVGKMEDKVVNKFEGYTKTGLN